MNDGEIYRQLFDRNARETEPFFPVYEANMALMKQVDQLQVKCSSAEVEIASLRQQVQELGGSLSGSSKGAAHHTSNVANNSTAMKSALQNENRLREKLELLQRQVQDAESRTLLAEQQYDGLKSTIRTLQEENDALRAENRVFESRLVSEKEKAVDEMNALTEMVESLKRENDMLKSLQQQESERAKSSGTKTSWFGGSSKKEQTNVDSTTASDGKNDGQATSPNRKFGEIGKVVVPTTPQRTIAAHTMEGTFVKYHDTGSNLIVTASSDGTVKVWDSSTGSLKSTFRGSPGHSILCCDTSGTLVIGGGSDKTCRVWNLRTERMIHQLVGHQHKITCARLIGGDKGVITGSADRSLKVWDIRSKTYRQTTTLRHSSTSTCVDVASDAVNVVSGHMDGGLRFWDLQSGERTADISGIHEGGITSVQFNPADITQVLTNSLDSTLKIVDVRSGAALFTFQQPEYVISTGWSRSVFSPDGRYVASGSNSIGTVFVWDTSSGQLKSKLNGAHASGVVGIDWNIGGSGGQQVASIDRKGTLVLWA